MATAQDTRIDQLAQRIERAAQAEGLSVVDPEVSTLMEVQHVFAAEGS